MKDQKRCSVCTANVKQFSDVYKFCNKHTCYYRIHPLYRKRKMILV